MTSQIARHHKYPMTSQMDNLTSWSAYFIQEAHLLQVPGANIFYINSAPESRTIWMGIWIYFHKYIQFSVVSQHHEGVILDLSQSARLWQLAISHGELMVHAGCGATRSSHQSRSMLWPSLLLQYLRNCHIYSSLVKVYATKIHMCKFWREKTNDRWVKRTWSKHDQ